MQNQDGSTRREFDVGAKVLLLNGRPGSRPKWLPGVILQRLGPVSYLVESNSALRHVHVDHLKIAGAAESEEAPTPAARHTQPPITPLMPAIAEPLPPPVTPPLPNVGSDTAVANPVGANAEPDDHSEVLPAPVQTPAQTPAPVRTSAREVKRRKRLIEEME